jgi:hypothetical protein
MSTDRETLIARRVPREDIILGRAYVIHARNGGIGVARRSEDGMLSYTLHREKFGEHYLFDEYDWEDDDRFGTAIPLRLLPDLPPEGERLLHWLAEREVENQAEIADAWNEVLGALGIGRVHKQPEEQLAFVRLESGDLNGDIAQEDAAPEWDDEVARRMRSVQDGTAVLHSDEHVEQRIREILKS